MLLVTNPRSKMNRLFQEVAVRGRGLCSFSALARQLGITSGAISQVWGHRHEKEGVIPPGHQLGAIVRAFNREGVPVHLDWFYKPLETFNALLEEAGRTRPAIASWGEIVWNFARSSPALRYHRAETRGLRRAGDDAAAAPECFKLEEPVRIVLDPPPNFLGGADAFHAMLLCQDQARVECLFPVGADASVIFERPLLFPRLEEAPFKVTGPTGAQHIFAVVTRFAMQAPVHAALVDTELHAALDVLASELAGRPRANWALYSASIEVVP